MKLKFQAGSEIIEFALVLPLLLILVFGIIDFSIAFYDKAVVTNASREGARAGIVLKTPRLGDNDIKGVVGTYCSTNLITFGGAAFNAASDVSVTGAGGASGEDLTVTVTWPYSYAVISHLIPSLGSLNLRATTVMKME